jgi:carbon-monoxide dehydrogenase medium subunit
MIPASFDYHAPNSVAEALTLLDRYRDDAKVLAGGQSLLPLLKLRLAQLGHIVDIGRIPGLDYIKEEGGMVRIGAGTTEAALERSALIKTKLPILVDTTAFIGDPLVRNRATVGGNLAHGDPANDHPAAMLALGAQVVIRGSQGERVVPIEQFFTGLFRTALKPNELLVEVRIPTAPPRSGGAYFKLERKVGDFATAGVAAQVTLGASGAIERAGLGLTNAGPKPIKAVAAEQFLGGKQPDDATLREAGSLAAKATSPVADRRGAVDYKREMARVLTVRALRAAVARAGGK